MRGLRTGLLVVGVVALVAVPAAAAHEGDIDLGFGSGGQVITSVGASTGGTNDEFNDVLIDGRGRLVAVGDVEVSTHDQLSLVRYTPAGALDPSFGTQGVVQRTIGVNTFPAAVARDGKGRLVVVGTADAHSFVARFRPDGTPDAFGAGGVVTKTIGAYHDDAVDAAVDAEGRIVVVGRAWDAQFDRVFVDVFRLLPDGELDKSFGGGDGKVKTPVGDTNGSASAVRIDAKGRIVVAVNGERSGVSELGAVRYLPTGALDKTFGSSGKRLTAIGSANVTAAQDLVLDGRGRIVLGGFSNFKFALVRYTAGGDLDRSFGSDGIVTTAVSPRTSQINALTIDPQGRLVAAGQAAVNAGYSDVAVARYLPSGKLDPSFGSRGQVITFVGKDNGFGTAVATDAKSGILVAGSAYSGSGPRDSLLVRYVGDETPPRVTVAGPTRVSTRHRKHRVRFTLGANEPVRFTCRVDGRTAKPCGTRYRTPALRAGRHVLRVVATDPAGNRETAKKRFRIVRSRTG